MVVEKNKRKSLPQKPKSPINNAQTPNKKPKFEKPSPAKTPGQPQQQQSPPKTPGKTPNKMKIEVVQKNGNAAANKPDNLKQINKNNFPIQKQKNKQNKQKFNKNDGGQKNKNAQGQGKDHKKHIAPKKNRHQRQQQRLDQNVRTEESCARALKLEHDLIMEQGRVITVKLADTPISTETIKKWSGAIENAIFPKPVEPRTFLVVLKAKSNIKKEIENLKKISFGGGKLTVEERNDFEKGFNNPEAIDPYTLYLTNLPMTVTREELKNTFPKCDHIMNPRKHNPGKTGGSHTKFTFISFKDTDDALEALKDKYNTEIQGSSVVMRFRRVSLHEAQKKDALVKESDVAAKKANNAKAEVAKKEAPSAKTPAAEKKTPLAQVKVEAKDDDDDDDDDDEEEDDEAESGDEEEVEEEEGAEAGSGQEEEDDDDDDDDDDDELDDEEEDDSD